VERVKKKKQNREARLNFRVTEALARKLERLERKMKLSKTAIFEIALLSLAESLGEN
jgi:hypothetical protein